MLETWFRTLNSDAMQCNASDIWHFLFYSKEIIKLGQKTGFLARFEKFFIHALLQPISCAPIFTPNEKSNEDT